MPEDLDLLDVRGWGAICKSLVLRMYHEGLNGSLIPPLTCTLSVPANGKIIFQFILPALDGQMELGPDCPPALGGAPVSLPLRVVIMDGRGIELHCTCERPPALPVM